MDFRILVSAGLASLSLGGSALAADATFKDWWAVCDNTRDCTAFGFAPEDGEDHAYLKLSRGGAAGAPITIAVVAGLDETTWALAVDGKVVPGLGAVPARENGMYLRATLTGAQSAALVSAMANGNKLDIMSAGQRISGVSLAGSSATMRWVDDQQKRAGTVSAMLAKGDKPASVIPAPPAVPVVKAAAPVPQKGLGALPRGVQAKLNDCDDSEARVDPIAGRLAPGVVLWGAVCSQGAYNIVYSLFLTNEQGGEVRAAPIAYPEADEVSDGLMNITYDARTQTLSNFAKARGIGDCGTQNAWVWDGRQFAPTHQSLMGYCRGVPLEDWPVSYRTRAR